MLDGRHADVRAEDGLVSLESRARDDVTLWRRLAESPYDDVRLFLISELEGRVAGREFDRIAIPGLNAETMRLLWASVLLTFIGAAGRSRRWCGRPMVRDRAAGGGRGVAVATDGGGVRSARGPERRAGLAAVAELVERRPQIVSRVGATFPELKWL